MGKGHCAKCGQLWTRSRQVTHSCSNVKLEKGLLITDKEILKLKEDIPWSAELLEIKNAEPVNTYKQYDRRVEIIYKINSEIFKANMSIQRAG